MKASDRPSDSSESSSDTTHPRAGGGKTTADLPAGGGRPGGLPFMDVQLKSDEGSWLDPIEMARTGSIDVAKMFFAQATHNQRIEILMARAPRYERIALIRTLDRSEVQQLLRGLPDNVKRTLVSGDGIDDLLSAETLADILNAHKVGGFYSQPKLSLQQMMEVWPMLENDVRHHVLLGNEAHATPVFNRLDDGELEALLRDMKRTLPAITRRIIDNLPGHLRDRVRKAIKGDESLADLMPVDATTDDDMARSQTDPSKAWLWDSTFRDEGTKNLPPAQEWAELPSPMRQSMFVAAAIDKRVAYLAVEPENKSRLLRALDAENRVQTVLAFVKKHPRKRSMLADLKAEDIIPVLADGAVQPAEAAALFLASSYNEQQLIGPVMTPLQVAALFSVDDVEETWIKGWSNVPETLIAAAFLRMDHEKLSSLLFYAGDSAVTMRKMLPEGHPLKHVGS